MIQFRAWDKETNKYFEPTYQAYMGRLEELTISLSGRLKKRTCRGMVDESMFPGRYDVEQFTGLKDVNGKEIYEGDIIKSNYKYAQPKISQIIMEDGNSYIAGEDLATGNEMLVSDHVNEVEIIGNVHTKPELLEADK